LVAFMVARPAALLHDYKVGYGLAVVFIYKGNQLVPMHLNRGVTLPIIGTFLFNLPPAFKGLVAHKSGNDKIAPGRLTGQAHERKVLHPWYPALHLQNARGDEFFKFARRRSRFKLPQTH
jgi:hypothetical protein